MALGIFWLAHVDLFMRGAVEKEGGRGQGVGEVRGGSERSEEGMPGRWS